MKKIIKLFVSISTIIMVVFSPFTALTPVASACYVPSQPDLTITKTNNLGGGNAVVDTPFIWKIRVENTGNATATFDKNEMIVKDNMPSSHVGTYGTVSVSASAGVTGVPSKLNCYQNGTDDADLVCRVKNTNGYSITIPAGDYIDFSVTVNPTSVGTITNPKPGSGNICDVDHEHKIDESNESNNACSDSVNIVAVPVCGNGVKEGNEQCDGTDGVPEHYTCTTQCTLEYVPFCGDQTVNDSETCEIGQTHSCEVNGYQGNQPCNQDCMGWGECIPTESCGDGILNDSEQCDDGAQNGQVCEPPYGDSCQYCSSICAFITLNGPFCGDQIINDGEICEIGNTQECTTQEGYSGLKVCNEQCSGWGDCASTQYCGEGAVNGNEQCDDGNTQNGDGCSSICEIEEEQECIPEGGSGPVIPDGMSCCLGLVSIGCDVPDQSGICSQGCVGAFYCTMCGDDVCGAGENKCNCPEDCEEEPVCNPEQELVLNGDFESPVVVASQKWDIFNTSQLSSWIVEWATNEPSYQGTPRPVNAYLELQRGVNGWLPQGDEQHAELDSDWDGPSGSLNNEPASTRIYQDISTVPGQNYNISFYFSPRPGTDNTENKLEFSWNGDIKDTLTGTGGSNTIWNQHTYEFTATGSTTRLQFTDKGIPNSLGTFLDTVSVRCKAGPEPECTDNDGDGYSIEGEGCGPIDCDDTNSNIHPNATEICNNQIDDDCDGLIDGADPYCETPAPYCGDASCNGSENCSSCSQDCGGCGGGFISGGGGGGGIIQLMIFNERLESIFGTGAIVSWSTNIPATSRVVYDTVPHALGGTPPNYGYAYSTIELPMPVTFHVMAITGLTPNTIYYWRPISHGSGEALGQELVFATVTSETLPPIVETPGTPGTPTGGETPGETGIPELTQPSATEIGIPEITEVGQGQGMLSGFLAAIGGFFNLNNFCQILLLVTLILIILLGLSLYSSKRKEYRIWILSIVILIAIFLYRGMCFWKYWWILFLIAVIVAIAAYFLGEKKNKQAKIEFLK
jgi:cysteine-rich repeat protein